VRRRILLSLGILGLLVAGIGAALYLKARERPQGKLDTELKGVSVQTGNAAAATVPKKRKGPKLGSDKRCWMNFGGDPQRTLARPSIDIGLPYRRFWSVGLGSYIEYPPSYCNGILYVNTFYGKTSRSTPRRAHVSGKRQGGHKPSTPAIAGDAPDRLVDRRHVTAYNRFNGRSSGGSGRREGRVVAGRRRRLVYFGATDGRLFACHVRTGRVQVGVQHRRPHQLEPVDPRQQHLRHDVRRLDLLPEPRRRPQDLEHYLSGTRPVRELLREPSTDGKRLFTISRSGGSYALSASDGHVSGARPQLDRLLDAGVAHGRVFIGGFDGYAARVQREHRPVIWSSTSAAASSARRSSPASRLLLEPRAEHVRAASRDGKVVWHLDIGKYSPGIVTDRHYFFTLNGIVQAWHGAARRRSSS
jgi:hypothetical protein